MNKHLLLEEDHPKRRVKKGFFVLLKAFYASYYCISKFHDICHTSLQSSTTVLVSKYWNFVNSFLSILSAFGFDFRKDLRTFPLRNLGHYTRGKKGRKTLLMFLTITLASKCYKKGHSIFTTVAVSLIVQKISIILFRQERN